MSQRSFDADAQRQARWIAFSFAALAYVAGYSVLHFEPLHNALKIPAWPVQFDFILTVPLVYWWLQRRAGSKAWKGALALTGFGVFLATQILPADNAPLLQGLSLLRNLGLLALALIELGILVGLATSLRGMMASANPEDALADAVEKHLGTAPLARFLRFESRMWLYLFARQRRPWRFRGDVHFSYHAKDGNASFQKGMIGLMLIETPILHFMLNLWSGKAAWIVTAASVYAIAFFIANYRATLYRPISLDDRALYVRNGLFGDVQIPLRWIESVAMHRGYSIRREPGVMRFRDGSFPNIVIQLHEPHDIADTLNTRVDIRTIYLGVDTPAALIEALDARTAH